MRYRNLLLAICVPSFLVVACEAGKTTFSEDDGTTTTTSTSSGGGQGGATTTTSSSTGQGGFNPTGGGSPTPGCNDVDPDSDYDNDGYTENQGDCNDCDENVNPNAIEVATPMGGGGGAGGAPPEPADEDCDGMVDNLPQPCDAGLAIDSSDPMDGARAIGLCKVSNDPNEWGVASAQWTYPNGTIPPANPNFDLGHGILTGFGAVVNVQEGSAMLALSSGTARQPTDPGYQNVGGFS